MIRLIDRSSVFVHVNNTLNGITTIRACKNIQFFINSFESHMNDYTKVCSSTISVQRWFALRLESICFLFTTVTIFSCILGKSIIENC